MAVRSSDPAQYPYLYNHVDAVKNESVEEADLCGLRTSISSLSRASLIERNGGSVNNSVP
jgi:hypothetical protein